VVEVVVQVVVVVLLVVGLCLQVLVFNFLLVPEPVFLGRSDFLAGQKVRPSGLNIF
jgi:hypothetical protein